MSSFALRVLVLVLALAQAAVATLAFVDGPRLGELLDRHPAHVVPVAGSLVLGAPILVLCVVLASMQLLPARRADTALDHVALPTAVAFLAATGWMLVGRAQHLVRATLGLYLGWASVGVIALAGHAAHAYGWNGFGLEPRFWAYLALVTGGFAVAGEVGALRGSLAAAAGAIWSFVAIALGQWGADARLLTAPAVGTAAMFAAVLVAISCVVAVGNRRAMRRLSARRRFAPPFAT